MLRTCAGVMVVAMAGGLGGIPSAVADTAQREMQEPAAQPRDTPRSSRLRFRSGPACMCSDGLGEAEIEAAERRRLDSIVGPRDPERR